MQRRLKLLGMGLISFAMAGCCHLGVLGPMQENPAHVNPGPQFNASNPVYVPLGPNSYGVVFERTIDVVDDFFEISYANRYDGRIETQPRVAPGFEQPWRNGNPNMRQRLQSTLQTIRQRCFVLIQPADDGGYFVQVQVFRELEDLPRPIRSTAGSASFRSDNSVDRTYEVVDPAVFETNWIPIGRNTDLEQKILEQLKNCM